MTPRPSAAGADPVSKDLLALLAQTVRLQGVVPSPTKPLCVAYSGGRDSTALLHAAVVLWPGAIRAIHVHHGLQAAADDFAVHCGQICTEWRVPLSVALADLRVQAGDSTEEVARNGRYLALARGVTESGGCACLLAQHATDQVETVLLALSRGAGPHGLAGMPLSRGVGGVVFLRPWVTVPGEAVRAYAQTQGLRHVEDPTNADLKWTRNRIRHRLIPVLLREFPSLHATVARSAAHSAAAARLLDERAAEDLQQVGQPPRLAALREMGVDRLDNVLRFWLRGQSGRAPATAQLHALTRQIAAACTRGHRIDVPVAQGRVQREADYLVYLPGKRGEVYALKNTFTAPDASGDEA